MAFYSVEASSFLRQVDAGHLLRAKQEAVLHLVHLQDSPCLLKTPCLTACSASRRGRGIIRTVLGSKGISASASQLLSITLHLLKLRNVNHIMARVCPVENRIMELLRLVKNSKITNPNSPHHTHWPCTQVPHLHISWTCKGTVTPAPPYQPVPMHLHSFQERIFPNLKP